MNSYAIPNIVFIFIFKFRNVVVVVPFQPPFYCCVVIVVFVVVSLLSVSPVSTSPVPHFCLLDAISGFLMVAIIII